MAKYTYEGNRDGTNTASSFTLDGKTYNIGDEVELSAAERDRLAPIFILSNKDGDDVGEGLDAPTNTPVTSGSGDTIPEEKSSPSASSKKS